MLHSIFLWLSLGAVEYASAGPGHQQARRQNGPVPPDTIKDCTYFYDSQPGDTCVSIASYWGLSLEQFKTYNPSVESDCSGLIIGTAYCVEQNYGMGPAPPETTASTSSKTTTTTSGLAPPETTTSTSSKTSTTTSGPSPTGPTPVQSGISSQCE